MPKWVAATALLVLVAAFSAGIIPWLDALGGAFAPPDFAQDVAAARALANREDPYAANFAALHAEILGTDPGNGYPYLPHPPFAIILASPIAGLTFSAAALCWFAASLACSFVLAIVLSGVARSGHFRLPPLTDALVCFAALLVWPPVLYNLEKGQFSILIATLLALGWVWLSRRDCRAGGICLGLAAALKLFPALLGVYLLLRRKPAAMWSVIAGLVVTMVPILWIGWRGVPEFVAQSAGNVSYWQTWPAVTYSLRGLAARLFIGSKWSRALTYSPEAATAAVTLASAVLFAMAVRTTMRSGRGEDADAVLFAIWSVLLLPLNPLAMGHNGVLLALPIVLIGRALAADPRRWLKMVWSAGSVLVSIPRQAIFDAAPFPVSPWRSFAIVALPMWGTVLLFTAGIAIANRCASSRAER